MLCAQDTAAAVTAVYERYRTASGNGDVPGLSGIATQYAAAGSDAERRLGRLAGATALFRQGRMQPALAALDSMAVEGAWTDPRIGAMVGKLRAAIELWAGNDPSGLRIVDEAIHRLAPDRFPREEVELLVGKAEILVSMDSLATAFDLLSAAERIARGADFAKGIGMAFLNKGNIAFKQGRYDEAISSYTAVLAQAKGGGMDILAQNATSNLAAVAVMRKEHARALALIDSLLNTPGHTDDLVRARLLSSSGYVLLRKGDPAAALQRLDSALSIQARLAGRNSDPKTCQHKASALWQLGRRTEAMRWTLRALDLAQGASDDRAVSELLWALHERQDSLGRPDSALYYLRLQTEVADRINKTRFDERMARSEVLFDTERKERRIAEQQQALDLAASEDRRKSLQRNIFIGVAAFAALVAGLLWRLARSRRQRLEQEKELHGKTVDELLQKNEITAMHAMFEGQEKERDRVARDLHDRVGSMLGNVKMQMEVLEERMDTDQQEREGQYKKVYGLLVETVGEVRRISHDMVAGTLARFGLEKALEGLCDSVRVTGRLAVELRVFGLENRLERGVEITVYRIVQELVGNTLKHAKATELSIDVTRTPGRLSVIVADNGVGFDTSAASEGMGLANVRKRAAAIGGAITIDSTPGKGTTVSVEGPVLE